MGRVLALICAPFAAIVLGAAVLTAWSALGCDPHVREVVLSPDGAWRDPPRRWQGKLPSAEALHPAYYENLNRSRRLGACQ